MISPTEYELLFVYIQTSIRQFRMLLFLSVDVKWLNKLFLNFI